MGNPDLIFIKICMRWHHKEHLLLQKTFQSYRKTCLSYKLQGIVLSTVTMAEAITIKARCDHKDKIKS